MQLPFRSAASTTSRRFSGILATALLAAGYAVAPVPAAARDIKGLPSQCAKAGNDLAKLKCGSAYYQQMKAKDEVKGRAADAQRAAAEARSVDTRARSAAADKQIAANKASKYCYDALLDEVNAAKKLAPLTPDQKTAFKNRAASCEKS